MGISLDLVSTPDLDDGAQQIKGHRSSEITNGGKCGFIAPDIIFILFD